MSKSKLLIMLLAAVVFMLGNAAVGQSRIGQWDVFEISMEAQKQYANPYTESLPDKAECLVRITFTGTGGEAQGQSISIAGFWAGGQTFKGRFAPPLPGAWAYKSVSSDPGLNGESPESALSSVFKPYQDRDIQRNNLQNSERLAHHSDSCNFLHEPLF